MKIVVVNAAKRASSMGRECAILVISDSKRMKQYDSDMASPTIDMIYSLHQRAKCGVDSRSIEGLFNMASVLL